MSRPTNFFAPEEWYHCYSRGIDNRVVFESTSDYQRFISLLYLANTSTVLHRSNLGNLSYHELFTIPRKETLVSIGAYALMPNHFHLLLYEKNASGISTFMQKLGTAYTMYFNVKRERSGGLFTKPFRARHISDDRYLQHIIDYIHLNSLKLFENGHKRNNKMEDKHYFMTKLKSYPFSSFPDFNGTSRPAKVVLGNKIFNLYQQKTASQMIENSFAYAETFSD